MTENFYRKAVWRCSCTHHTREAQEGVRVGRRMKIARLMSGAAAVRYDARSTSISQERGRATKIDEA